MSALTLVRTHLGDFIRSEFPTGTHVVAQQKVRLGLKWNGNQFRAIWKGGRTFAPTQVTKPQLIPGYVQGLMDFEPEAPPPAHRASAAMMAHEPFGPADLQFDAVVLKPVVVAWRKEHPDFAVRLAEHRVFFDATRIEGPWGIGLVPPTCFLTACRVLSHIQPGNGSHDKAVLFCHRLSRGLINDGDRALDRRGYQDLGLDESPTATWREVSVPEHRVVTFEIGGQTREVVIVPLDAWLFNPLPPGFEVVADPKYAATDAEVEGAMGWAPTAPRLAMRRFPEPTRDYGGLSLVTGPTAIGKTHGVLHLLAADECRAQQVSAAAFDEAPLERDWVEAIGRGRSRLDNPWAWAAVAGVGGVERDRAAVVLDDLEELELAQQGAAVNVAVWLALCGTHAILSIRGPTVVSLTSPELFLRADGLRDLFRPKDLGVRFPGLLGAAREALGLQDEPSVQRLLEQIGFYAVAWNLPRPELSDVLEAVMRAIAPQLRHAVTGQEEPQDLDEDARDKLAEAEANVRLGLRRVMPHQLTRGLIPRALLPGAVQQLVGALEAGLERLDPRPPDELDWEAWAVKQLPFDCASAIDIDKHGAAYLHKLTELALPHLRKPGFGTTELREAGAAEVLRLAFVRHAMDPAAPAGAFLQAGGRYASVEAPAREVEVFLSSLDTDELYLLAETFVTLVSTGDLDLGLDSEARHVPHALVVHRPSRDLLANGRIRSVPGLDALKQLSRAIAAKETLSPEALRGLTLTVHADARPPQTKLGRGRIRALRMRGREVIVRAAEDIDLKDARLRCRVLRLLRLREAAPDSCPRVTLSGGVCDSGLHVGEKVILELDGVSLSGEVKLAGTARVVVEGARLGVGALASLAQLPSHQVEEARGLLPMLSGCEVQGDDLVLGNPLDATWAETLAAYGLALKGPSTIVAAE